MGIDVLSRSTLVNGNTPGTVIDGVLMDEPERRSEGTIPLNGPDPAGYPSKVGTKLIALEHGLVNPVKIFR